MQYEIRNTPDVYHHVADGPGRMKFAIRPPALARLLIAALLTVSGTASAGEPSTSRPADSTIRFAVIGDYGFAGEPEQDVSNLVRGWNPDFIITTGDNNYFFGGADTIDQNIGQYYHDFIYPYTGAYGVGAAWLRFFPALGNHDWDTPTMWPQPYLDYFTLPDNERYYDFVWGPVHFFALDSDPREPDGIVITSTQSLWLQNALAASTTPWQLVYMHHPPYSSGGVHGSTLELQWPYQAWGADAVLAGHDHIYERLLHEAIPYFVNGLGGAPVQSLNPQPAPGSQIRFLNDYGVLLVTGDAGRLTFQFVTRAGLVIDTYSLFKSPRRVYLPITSR